MFTQANIIPIVVFSLALATIVTAAIGVLR